MREGFSIGRLFGINLRVDWSWLFVFMLVTWNLTAVFGQWHPSWGPFLSFGIAITASLLFFASVLAHELAHSLVARANGIRVHNITLFLFGGVSNFEREPTSPRVEFLSAIVGPLTSFALGVIFLLLGSIGTSSLTALRDYPELVIANLHPAQTLLLWLGPINIIVGLFNLIPGFPLDGGRVLRSILWAATNNLRKATRWAAGIGQATGWMFIVLGIAMAFGARVPFFGTGIVSGLWLAFIGWFLTSAAAQSYSQVVVREVLEGVPVARVMRTRGLAIAPEVSVTRLVDDFIMRTDERMFPVLDGESRLVGLVGMADVQKVPRDRWNDTLVRDIMTPAAQLAVTTPTEDLTEALAKMAARDVSQLPVMEVDRLVGVLRRHDIARWLEIQAGSDAPGWRSEPTPHRV